MNNSSTTIHVWHATASTDQPGALESRCESWLRDEEIDRANRFRRPTSRNQHVVGRGMARRLLGGSNVEPREIQFAEHQYGKPYVQSPGAACQPFNVAHTDGLVMCGLGEETHELVGVDVEKLGRNTDPDLAERYFSKPEIQYLASKPDNQRQPAFLRVWTLKESFIKAIGTGLQTPLADFTFVDIDSPTPGIRMLNKDLDDGRTWRFFSLQPRPGFVAAVAVACPRQVAIQLRCFDDLID